MHRACEAALHKGLLMGNNFAVSDLLKNLLLRGTMYSSSQERGQSLANQVREKKTKWHSPMYRGLQLDLRDLPLQFADNISLCEEALEIDAVITKDADVQFEKDIAAIFRCHNICELKSETDYFSIADYSKVLGYAFLYSAFKGICITDITITIVVTKYPQKFVKFLEDVRKLQVHDRGNGIHYVMNDVFPFQILETKELSDDNLFTKNLRSNLTNSEMKKLLSALKDSGVTDKRDAYLACIMEANFDIFREVMNMVPELKERFMAAAEEDGWLEEQNMKILLERAKNMLSDGESPERVAKWMMLPIEKVESLV